MSERTLTRAVMVLGVPARAGRSRAIALLALGLLLALSVGSFEHLDHAFEPAAPIHTEASHPGAAAHLDREEHQDGERCLLCLHTRHPYVAPASTPCLPSGDNLPSALPTATLVAHAKRSSASPRAPPC